jgi:hypothetical protein
MGGAGVRRVGQADPRWKLDLQLARGVEPDQGRGGAGIQDVAAAGAVFADEVQVPAAHLDALCVGGEPEAHHRSLDVPKPEHVLIGDDLGERAVGRLLPWDRTGLDEREATVDPDGTGGGAGGNALLDRRQQRIVVERSLEAEVEIGVEGNDHRERGALGAGQLVDPALDVGPVEATVEGHHLPIEVIHGAEPVVALLGQLREADVTFEGALEQRADRRCLEENVWLVPAVEVRMPHRLDVQRPDPAFVEAHRSEPAVARALSAPLPDRACGPFVTSEPRAGPDSSREPGR